MRPVLAVSQGDLWLMSTPYGKRGFFWETWTKGGERWKRVCAPATECGRRPPAFLEEEREALGDRVFRQEYLCEFVEDDSFLFRDEDIEACVSKNVPALWLRRDYWPQMNADERR
jgi:hypothetical protein